ncbi:MAG: NAD(P)/FAD-dependent oxidoreductase, partial [Betaproteobacteria bacterium]|nr:NAD(P)/FAD-dependent oxidoreductase [Betaproteobacteria bacterium]
MNKSYDAIIIGAGHNGLVCACYLARAGLRVRVLERRNVIGGAAVTQEFAPGFRNSVAAYTVSLLNPKIIADLRLAQHGLRVVERPFANFLPLPEAGSFRLGPGLAATQAAVAHFSKRDAARLPDYYAMIERVAAVLRDAVLRTPPNVGGGIADLGRGAMLALLLKSLDMPARRDMLELFTRSAGEMLDDWFESDPLKAAFGFDAVVGNFASPYSAGSAYVLLHHAFGEVNGKRGAWGHAIGGMGAISAAIAAEALAHGVEISTDSAVVRVLAGAHGASGVALADGSEIAARAVIGNLNPKLLYLKLVDPALLDADFRARMERWKCGSGSFRMNVALSELPDFNCAPGRQAQPHHSSGIIIAPSLAYQDRAWVDARREGMSTEPIVEMLIPSTLDDSLAPPGQHVASLFCQQFNPELGDGRNWDDRRDEAAERIIDTVTRHAPNFRSSIVGRQMLSPLDLERDFGLVGGDIFHGRLSLDQLFSARPVLGYADYRS